MLAGNAVLAWLLMAARADVITTCYSVGARHESVSWSLAEGVISDNQVWERDDAAFIACGFLPLGKESP